jgi:serpin B
MMIILPRTQTDLKPSFKGIPVILFDQIRSNLSRLEVSLSLPRFKSETEINLNESLKLMGMQEAFNREADFSGMTGNKDLFIDFIVHKAFIDVNEKGTEAAAASGVGMALKSGYMGEPVRFNADHPFHYLIFNRESGVILFCGRFIKP